MSAKRRSRERSRFKYFLVRFLLLCLILGSIYLVWISDFFNIREVEIIGEELLAGYELPDIVGRNILFWEPSFELSELHLINNISVDKEYFKRRVVINLEERSRYMIWCFGEKECFWVDEGGVAFSEAPNLKGALTFRLVRDDSGRELKLGDIVLDNEQFKNIIAAFGFLEDLNIDAQELRIENLKFQEATARIIDGPDIYFSLMLDPSFGTGVVKSLRDSGEWDIIDYLDLRVPNRAYYPQ